MIDWARQLTDCTQTFVIEGMDSTLRGFPDRIDGLHRHIGAASL